MTFLAGPALFLSVVLCFIFLGHRLRLFLVCGCLLLIAGYLRARWAAPGAEAAAALECWGFLFFLAGLVLLRAIFLRSISLEVLLTEASGDPARRIGAAIERRLVELRHSGFLDGDADKPRLTRSGKLFAAGVRLIYRIFGEA